MSIKLYTVCSYIIFIVTMQKAANAKFSLYTEITVTKL